MRKFLAFLATIATLACNEALHSPTENPFSTGSPAPDHRVVRGPTQYDQIRIQAVPLYPDPVFTCPTGSSCSSCVYLAPDTRMTYLAAPGLNLPPLKWTLPDGTNDTHVIVTWLSPVSGCVTLRGQDGQHVGMKYLLPAIARPAPASFLSRVQLFERPYMYTASGFNPPRAWVRSHSR